MSGEANANEGGEGSQSQPQNQRPVPRLNERILSSLSRRSVAAHPWHDLEIGICPILFLLITSSV